MKREVINVFSHDIQIDDNSEVFDVILARNNVSLKLERIISKGLNTPEGKWYNQNSDEWVIVLKGEGKIQFYDGEIISLSQGDSLMILAHDKHKVIFTSTEPACVWLALHINNNA